MGTNQRELAVPDFVFERACEAGRESPCRSQRGVVIWDAGGIISVGYNHLQLTDCDRSDACKAVCGRLALHAEEHAIANATRSLTGARMLHVKIVNDEPVASGDPSCVRCSNQILAHGIVEMWLLHKDGLKAYSARDFHRRTIAGLFGESFAGEDSALVSQDDGASMPTRLDFSATSTNAVLY